MDGNFIDEFAANMPDIDDDGGGIDPMMSIASIDVDGNSPHIRWVPSLDIVAQHPPVILHLSPLGHGAGVQRHPR